MRKNSINPVSGEKNNLGLEEGKTPVDFRGISEFLVR